MTRARDLADTQDNLGGAVAPFVAAKNFVINGGMDLWQRGVSGTANSFGAGAGYNADRWQNYSPNALTVSRQATNDTTNLPNIQYCARVQRNSGQTSTSQVYHAQTFESSNSIPFAGKTVTISFYARAGANYSAASNGLIVEVGTGTGTDQSVFGFSGRLTPIAFTSTLTTTWQRFTATGVVSSSATQVGLAIYYTPTGTAGANDWFEVTGVQLELGSVATPFARAGGSIGGELALCQRYYVRYTQDGSVGTYFPDVTFGINSSLAISNFHFPVTMRIPPVTADWSGGVIFDFTNAASFAVTGISGNQLTRNNAGILISVASGLTAYRPYWFSGNGVVTTAFIGFSAEL
jgi:hypothetical protein